jgi:hypothetical protein
MNADKFKNLVSPLAQVGGPLKSKDSTAEVAEGTENKKTADFLRCLCVL